MSYFVRFLLLCCTVALAIPTYANALNERDAVVSRQTGKLQIRVHYPITGNARVDADVADWAHQAVDTFQNTYGEEPDLGVPYELETTYSTTRSTPVRPFDSLEDRQLYPAARTATWKSPRRPMI